MRTLKYRAYIKPLKRYAEKYETILFHHQCNMEPSWTVNISPEEYYGDEDLVIEQFTGLLDRNGKEIYEGDIMRYDAIDYKVLWADYYAGFETKRLNSPWNNAGLTLHFLASVGRVIGNIHENPELLEDK